MVAMGMEMVMGTEMEMEMEMRMGTRSTLSSHVTIFLSVTTSMGCLRSRLKFETSELQMVDDDQSL